MASESGLGLKHDRLFLNTNAVEGNSPVKKEINVFLVLHYQAILCEKWGTILKA